MDQKFWDTFLLRPQHAIIQLSLHREVIENIIVTLQKRARNVTIIHDDDSVPRHVNKYGKKTYIIRNFWGDDTKILTASEFYRRKRNKSESVVYVVLGLGRNLYEIEQLPHVMVGEWAIFPTQINLRGRYEGIKKYYPAAIKRHRTERLDEGKFFSRAKALTGNRVIYVGGDIHKWKNQFPDAIELGPQSDMKKGVGKVFLLIEGYEYLLPGHIFRRAMTVFDTQRFGDIRPLRPGKYGQFKFHSQYRAGLLNSTGGTLVSGTEKLSGLPMHSNLSNSFLVLYVHNIYLNTLIGDDTVRNILIAENKYRISSLPGDYLNLNVPWYCHALISMWMREKLPPFPVLVVCAWLADHGTILFKVNETNAFIQRVEQSTPLETALNVWRAMNSNLGFPVFVGKSFIEGLRKWCDSNGVKYGKILSVVRRLTKYVNQTGAGVGEMNFKKWIEQLRPKLTNIFPNMRSKSRGDGSYLLRGAITSAATTSTDIVLHSITEDITSPPQDDEFIYYLPQLPDNTSSAIPDELVILTIGQYNTIFLAIEPSDQRIIDETSSIFYAIKHPEILSDMVQTSHNPTRTLEVDLFQAPYISIYPPNYSIIPSYEIVPIIKSRQDLLL